MTSLEASLTGVFTSYQAVKLAEVFVSGSASITHGTSGAMVAGVVTVALASVTANTRVIVTRATPGGTLGNVDTNTARAPGVSFQITSSSATETSTFYWLAIEP